MNRMTVSPWLSVSPFGPTTQAHFQGEDLIHLRQGEMDGACGPYCVAMALITLGVMTRDEATLLHQYDGRSRLGRFRDTMLSFGALISSGTTDFEVGWLVECFSRAGVIAEPFEISARRKTTVKKIAESIDNGRVPIVMVEWDGGEAHWVLVIGYQGHETSDGELQITHLLCLDPSNESPKVSLWNAVIEVFTEDGETVNDGRYYCRHWGPSTPPSDCRLGDGVMVGLSPKHEARFFD